MELQMLEIKNVKYINLKNNMVLYNLTKKKLQEILFGDMHLEIFMIYYIIMFNLQLKKQVS